MRLRVFASILALSLLTLSAGVGADVKTDERSQVKFEGMLGRMVGFFGGKAAREGIVTRIALKGDRRSSMSEHHGEIVDLAEEKVYQLDVRKKTYTVKTFAEIRREMEEARKKAEKEQATSAGDAEKGGEKPEKEYEIDFDVKETGQKKAINGFDTRQVVMTVAVREKGKTLEQGGGIVVTADSWLASKVAGLDELAAFERRYAEKLMGAELQMSAQQLAAALALYPGLGEAMKRFEKENVNLEGTPISSVVTFAAVKSPEQMTQEKGAEEEEARPASIGGLMGGLGRKMARRKNDAEAAQQPSNRATIMTMTNEVLSVSAAVAPGDVDVPAGYTRK